MPCPPQQPPTPVSTENLRQPIVGSNTPHYNIVQLIPFPQSSTAVISRDNRDQLPYSTSAVNSRVNQFQ